MPTLEEMIKELPLKRQKEIAALGKKLIAEEMAWQELRKAQKITRVRMAKKLGVRQAQVSQIERQTDLYLSTLRRAVKAMGGELQLVVKFPDRPPVEILELEAS